MKIQVLGHSSFIGHTGYNNHSKNFFTNLNKYIPTKVRNYSYCDDLSYLKPEEISVILESSWRDPPYKIGTPFKRDPEAILVNIVLNESHHYYFYDHYDSPMIAYNVWEATKQIPEYFKRILEYDQFWCPTNVQRQWTIDQGYPEHRVKVVPEGVNGNKFKPYDGIDSLSVKKKLFETYGIPDEAFTFMIFGRWDYRKATTEMVQAFFEEFKNDNNVYLILSADNPFSMDGLKTTEERLKRFRLESEKIKVVHFPSRQDYVQFLQHGSCFLGCSRSEGWNFPLLEALCCGTPSIASNWGGHLEFASGFAHLVNVPKELPPKEIVFINNGYDIGVWGEPDFDHLKKVMRNVYSNYGEEKEDAVKKSKYLRELYTWDKSARIAETHIKELCKKHVYIPSHSINNIFTLKYELTDNNYPKVIFNTTRNFNKLKVVLKRLSGNIMYESDFVNVKEKISYWISASVPENQLDGIEVEIYDDKGILIHSDKKIYRNENPKISFVTSFYNSKKYIEEVASSILNQTYQDWEWVITDDFSCDDTEQKVKQLVNRDRRIRYVEQKYKQEIYWNPHKYSKGDIIVTIDSDDILVPKTASVLAHFFDKYSQVICIHTSANYYEETFESYTSFKNSSYCRMDKYDSVLQKHLPYLNNESGYERIGQMFGVIRAYRNPGPNFNFNDGDYELGKHEDLVKLLRLEEMGTPFYLNRTLYKVRMREKGSNSGTWKNHVGEIEFDKIRDITDKRRKKSYKHLDIYDEVREELYSLLYSNLHDERERKTICCLGFNLDIRGKQLLKEIYFDHKILFEEVDINTDYVFIKASTKNDVELFYNMTKNIKKAEISFFFNNEKWEPSYYNLENGIGYFKEFKECKDWLNSKTGFIWYTYLEKYCVIKYNIERTPKKLNLGCGTDIKAGYINVDKYNNTGNVDYQWDIGKLEVEDEDIDEIYVKHVFEHIGINDIYSVVEEWRRALKVNGDLIIRLPNLEYEVHKWLNTPDDKKWGAVPWIFGGQTHPGDIHYCGFNPGSLRNFIERFGFKVVELKEQPGDNGGNEIYMRAKKMPIIRKLKPQYICHFVDGPFLEIKSPKTDDYFVVDFIDPDNNSLVHQETMETNHWTRPNQKYFTNWLVQVKRNGIIDFKHKFNLKGKRVLISFDSKSLGDTISWIPATEEFRKKHNCEVWVSSFHNKLFEDCEEYKNLKFVSPGKVVENLYASYTIGCYDGNRFKNRLDWRLVPVQKIAYDILGLEYKETISVIKTQDGFELPTSKPYVAISEFSTLQGKFWNYPGGWQEVVNYLHNRGYEVVVISKEKTKLKNIIDRTNRDIQETINTIKNCEFYIGVSSGPAWIAWALKKPVIIVSGITSEWTEFKNKVIRVINKDVCNSCFNDPNNSFDRGDWDWCPRYKGTSRQFECTKQIIPNMVNKAIDNIIIERF